MIDEIEDPIIRSSGRKGFVEGTSILMEFMTRLDYV